MVHRRQEPFDVAEANSQDARKKWRPLVTAYTPMLELPKLKSRAAMYRAVLRHLRLIPDPVVWMWVIPRMRQACAWRPLLEVKLGESSKTGAEMNDQALVVLANSNTAKRDHDDKTKSLKIAKDILADVRAAVASHPHALTRLLQEAYGQRAKARADMIRVSSLQPEGDHKQAKTDDENVKKSSPPQQAPQSKADILGPGRPPLPLALQPLLHRSKHVDPAEVDKGYNHPRKGKTRKNWLREENVVPVPIRMPEGSGVFTGLERKGIAETIMAFAKIGEAYRVYEPVEDVDARRTEQDGPTPLAARALQLPTWEELPSFAFMPRVFRLMFPKKLKPTMQEPPFPRPPRNETRANPKTWHHPRRLTPRLLTRVYARFWSSLPWVRPLAMAEYTWDPKDGKDQQWVKCNYEEVLLWEQKRWTELREAEAGRAKKAGVLDAIGVGDATDEETRWLRMHRDRKQMNEVIDSLIYEGKRTW